MVRSEEEGNSSSWSLRCNLKGSKKSSACCPKWPRKCLDFLKIRATSYSEDTVTKNPRCPLIHQHLFTLFLSCHVTENLDVKESIGGHIVCQIRFKVEQGEQKPSSQRMKDKPRWGPTVRDSRGAMMRSAQRWVCGKKHSVVITVVSGT